MRINFQFIIYLLRGSQLKTKMKMRKKRDDYPPKKVCSDRNSRHFKTQGNLEKYIFRKKILHEFARVNDF